ncbi:MAG: gamma-glutamyltransferase [Parvularculaceae bacterium]|nr:gamma-glutamyltransferase [Parvularculaceae bacterium]
MRRLAAFVLALALAACAREDSVAQGAAASVSAALSTTAPSPAASGAANRNWTKGRYFISAANPYAVEAGEEILKRGGTAVDAAIAVQAVLGLVEPQSSGLGGGAFMLHYDPASGALEAYDGREVAPMSATPDRFMLANGEPMNFMDAVAGGLSVGVPGVVRMLEYAHQEHGSMDWRDLLAPARRLSTDGFKVSPRLNGLLQKVTRLKELPTAADYFYDKDGSPRPVGYVLKNPEYAETLRILGEEGPGAFYRGQIAREIVEAVNGAPNPGGMTELDILSYTAVKREPVCGPYRTLKVCSMPPPSSGGVTLLQMLSLLQNFDLKAAGPNSVEAIHLIFETSRLAYADRNQYLADQDKAAAGGGLTVEEVIDGLLNTEYLKARSGLIDRSAAATSVSAGDPSPFVKSGAAKWKALAPSLSPDPPSTSHFVVVDGEGRVVSMTTTVEFAFGSHLMAGGMILNNQLTDFSFLPERNGVPVANAVAPGKRPRSSMTPLVVFDGEGRLRAALGSPGGPAIIGYVAKTLIGVVDWGMSMQAAIDAPNIVYPRGAPIVETNGLEAGVLEGLSRLGHQVTQRELESGVHGFSVRPDGSFDGGADRRREGVWRTGVVEVRPED